MPFLALEKMHRLHDGYRKAFTAGGRNLLLFQSDGQIHIIENFCPHAGARFDKGSIRNGKIFCPWHGMAFDVDTGRSDACGLILTKYAPAYEAQSVGIYVESESL